ncbi:MAG: carboxypeptidase-like regulatory domain-containing protein [Candidatus Acidiferrales bacterium]
MDKHPAGRITVKRAFIFVLCAAMAAVAAPPTHHVATGTLAGTVVASDDAPIVGARVTVQQADGKHPHAMLTDTRGQFKFSRISAGPYDIRALANGAWSEWQHNIIVRPAKTTELTIRIEAKTSK